MTILKKKKTRRLEMVGCWLISLTIMIVLQPLKKKIMIVLQV